MRIVGSTSLVTQRRKGLACGLFERNRIVYKPLSFTIVASEPDGCVYAVDWDGQSYIKKVYKEEKGLRLVSTNEKYSDKFAPFTEEPRIIGKVVASFTPLEK